MISKAVRIIRATFRLLIRKLPYFALTFLSILAILYGAREIYRYAAPGEWYFKYLSLDVADGVEAGVPVSYQACRVNTGEYTVDVTRNIYSIPDTNRPKDRFLVKQSIFENARTSDIKCVDSFIRLTEFEHTEGTYQIVMLIDFSIHGNEKRVSVESNIYQIDSKTFTNEELLKRIDELEEEIKQLRSQLQAQAPVVQTHSPPPAEPHTTSEPPEDPPAAPAPTAQASTAPQSEEPSAIVRILRNLPLIGGLFR